MQFFPPEIHVSTRLRAVLVYAYDLPVAPGAGFQFRERPPLTAWYVRAGGIRLRSDGATRRVRAGQWVLLPERPRESWMEPATRIVSVRFRLSRPGGAPVFDRIRPLRIEGEREPGLEMAAMEMIAHASRLWCQDGGRDHFESMRGEGTPARRLADFLAWSEALAAWARAFLAAVTRRGWRVAAEEAGSPGLRRALAFLEVHPLAEPPRLTDIARAAGLSVSQLKRSFRQEAGTTPMGWWDRRRRAEATRRLRETAEPLKALAYELGFSSPAHFSTWFRQQAGVSPSAFRRTGGHLDA